MAYTVFDDDVASPQPKKLSKSSPKKTKSPEKRASVNGHADPAPVASTSKAILPPAKPDTSIDSIAEDSEATAVFRKRKASMNGANGEQKSKRRSLGNGGSSPANGSSRTTTDQDTPVPASTSQHKDRSRPSTPLVTSKRISNFYDDEDQLSEGDEAASPGKARAIETRPGESKKQARKRLQADRKEKAQHLLSVREKLPVYAVKDAILKEIEERDTVVILGETGSGKTTREWSPLFFLKML